MIVRELGKTGPGCTRDERAAGERLLVDHAPGLTVGHLRRLAVQVRDRLDEDGTEPREQVLRRRRSLVITTRDGMTHIDWWLDAESAGYVLPQITAYVTRDLRDPAHTGTGASAASRAGIGPGTGTRTRHTRRRSRGADAGAG